MPAKQLEILDGPSSGVHARILEQIETGPGDPNAGEYDTAISIIQHHLEKEARNRQVSSIWPIDLCPTQKHDLVKDLKRAFVEG